MKRAFLVANLGVAVLAAGTLVYAGLDNGPRATLMSVSDYNAAAKAIDTDARVAAVVCKQLTGHEKALCTAEIAAETKVRLAELESRYLGTYQSRHSARLTRIDAQFEVDKARCAAFSDTALADCLRTATQTRSALVEESSVS